MKKTGYATESTDARKRWPGWAVLFIVLVVFLGACTADSGNWVKAGIGEAAFDADLQACQADANQQMAAEAQNPYAFRSPRYSYTGPRRGLFGPFASDDNSNVRRQVEGDIVAVSRARWRVRFGACMEARGYRYQGPAAE